MNGMSNMRHLLTFLDAMSLAANHRTGLIPATNGVPRNIPFAPPRPFPWKRVVDGGRGVRQVRPGGLSGPCSGNDTPGSGCPLITRFLDVQQEEEDRVKVSLAAGLFRECYFVRERKCEFLRLKFKRIFGWNCCFRYRIYFCIFGKLSIVCCTTSASLIKVRN